MRRALIMVAGVAASLAVVRLALEPLDARPAARSAGGSARRADTAARGPTDPAQDAQDAPVLFRGDAAHTGVYATRGLRAYGGIAWRVQTGGPVRSTPAVAGGTIYIGSADHHLLALDRQTGAVRWRFRAGAPVNGSPAVADGVVYVTDQASTLYAVDAADGRLRWRVETGPPRPFPWGYESGDLFASSPTVVGSTVFFGAGDGFVYAVYAASGDRPGEAGPQGAPGGAADPGPEAAEGGRIRWRLETGGRVRSTPAVADGVLYVGSADGAVYAADAATGARLWRHETEGAGLRSGDFGYDRRTVQSSPAVADGRVFVGARDGHLYALDAATGERLWRSDERISWVNSSPAVADGLVYAGTSDAQFVQAVDAATGQERWRRESAGIVWTSPSVVGEHVIFAEGAGRIRAFDRRSGEPAWESWVGGRFFGSPVVSDGVLFVGSEDGGVYAIRDGGGAPLRRAVFWDSAFARAASYREPARLARWLGRKGYEVLDVARLEAFLEARIADAAPSAVVFAIDRAPDPVARGREASLLRRYLEAGGTVVWPGSLPLLWPRDPATGERPGGIPAIDRARVRETLGLDASAANFDPLGVWPAPAGRALGLPARALGLWSIDPAPGLVPLAHDENGRLAAWRRSFGGPPGTGLVRIWPSRDPVPDPTPILVAAELRPFGAP